ncbi:MAG: hypothetical protein WDO12_13665 [Pseudomonadota bacterium]
MGRERTRVVLGDWPERSNALVVDAQGQYALKKLTSGRIGQ